MKKSRRKVSKKRETPDGISNASEDRETTDNPERRPISAATHSTVDLEPIRSPSPQSGEFIASTSFSDRSRMARKIVDFEARRDAQGRIVVYRLSPDDGGGRYEVAGINERYHKEEADLLVALIEAGRHNEAESYAAEFIANYTDVADRWCRTTAVEFYLRDCVFNRGPGGAAWIVQHAVGVETDRVVGTLTRDAIARAEQDPARLLGRLRASRETYERRKRNESSPYWRGLVNRWENAKAFALTFLGTPGDRAPVEALAIAVNANGGDTASRILDSAAADSPLARAGRGSIDLSSDGKIAIGRNGLSIEYRGRDSCPYGSSATRNRRAFEAVIIHHTAPDHNTDWYVQYQIDGDPARGGHFGYHFYIAPDGAIIQGAPLTKRTNHVKPSGEPQRRPFGRHANNTNAIGITCVGAGRPSFQPTPQQVDSVERLTAALCQTYNVGFGKIYGHGEIQTDRHSTEGRSAAETMRRWTPTSGPAGAMHEATLLGENDDLDDGPIFELEMSAGLTDPAAADRSGVSKVSKVYQDLQEQAIFADSPEMDRPPRSALGDQVLAVFEPVPGVNHRIRGEYPNGVEGLIVHYDAFRIRKMGSKEENSDARTIQMIQSGSDNGFRYAEISRTGRIFVPANWDFQHWGSHAGTSTCPVTGRPSVSQYYVGVEMNNPGLLYESQTDGEYCPWYNSKLNANGQVILDGRGRCYRKSATDETYTKDEVRYASGGNITKGYYLPYSRDQFDSLVAIIRHLKGEYSGSFRVDRVFGHDEVSPGRKQDPGGALAYDGRLLTMAAFRDELLAGV